MCWRLPCHPSHLPPLRLLSQSPLPLALLLPPCVSAATWRSSCHRALHLPPDAPAATRCSSFHRALQLPQGFPAATRRHSYHQHLLLRKCEDAECECLHAYVCTTGLYIRCPCIIINRMISCLLHACPTLCASCVSPYCSIK